MLKKEYLWLISLFILSLVLRVALLDYTYFRVIEIDGTSYVNGAKGFLDGFDIRKINIMDQPLFPILIAFFSWIAPDWETAGRMVSITAGSLIGPLIFLISNAKGNSLKVSIFSGLIAAITPIYITASFQVFSDTLNCLLLLVAFWQLILALRDKRNLNFILSGGGFALAYLTRHDSIVPFFFAFIVLAWHMFTEWKGMVRWIRVTTFIASFAIIAFPYILFLHSYLGIWAISGRHATLKTSFSGVKALNNEDVSIEKISYGLTEDLEMMSDPLVLIKQKGGSTDSILTAWTEDPSERFYAVAKNLKIEWDVFVFNVPWYLLMLTVVTISSQRSKFIKDNMPLFAYSSPLLLLYPLFWVEDRHLFHFFLPIYIWAVEGVESLPSLTSNLSLWRKTIGHVSYLNIFKNLVFVALGLLPLLAFRPKIVDYYTYDDLRQKEMGVWISKNTPKNSVIMARYANLTFYTDRKTFWFPYAEWNDVKRYMKKNGITHLVVDDSFLYIRPQVKNLLLPLFSDYSGSTDDLLSIIKLRKDRRGGIIVYEVKKSFTTQP